jgi:anti-sigma regulatory factor (Ser/Thr protein kinase)
MVTAGNTTDLTLGFELRMKPDPRMVSRVRRMVEREFSEGGGDAEAVNRLAMVTHELLANAVKYASSDEVTLEVHLDPTGGEMSARMTNTTSAQHRERLRARVEQLQNSARPSDLAEDWPRRPLLTEGELGLGLARIFMEGHLDLNLEDHGDSITIEASSVKARNALHE